MIDIQRSYKEAVQHVKQIEIKGEDKKQITYSIMLSLIKRERTFRKTSPAIKSRVLK